MCGIVGLAFFPDEVGRHYFSLKNKNPAYKRVFKSMLSTAQPLGDDATGAFIATRELASAKKHNIHMYKQPGPVSKFLDSPKGGALIDDCWNLHDTIFAVGHVRAATGSSASDNRNNHPFITDNMIGVHNGIISNHRQLAAEAHLSLRGTCDSEVIFSMINQFAKDPSTPDSPAPTMDAVLQAHRLLNGWYTCVMMDQRDFSRLVLFRSRGPLSMMFDPDNRVLLFASRRDIITSAATTHGFSVPRFVDVPLADDHGMIVDVYKENTPLDSVRFDLNFVETPSTEKTNDAAVQEVAATADEDLGSGLSLAAHLEGLGLGGSSLEADDSTPEDSEDPLFAGRPGRDARF